MHDHQNTTQRAAYVLARQRIGQRSRRAPLDCYLQSVARAIHDELALIVEIKNIEKSANDTVPTKFGLALVVSED